MYAPDSPQVAWVRALTQSATAAGLADSDVSSVIDAFDKRGYNTALYYYNYYYQTGPYSPSDGLWFVYADSNWPNNGGKIFSMTKEYDLSIDRITFDYHMYGADVGVLWLKGSADSGVSWRTLWTKKYSQGGSWKQADVTIDRTSYRYPTQLRFEYKTGKRWRGYIALDSVSVTPSPADAVVDNEGSRRSRVRRMAKEAAGCA